MAPGSSTPAPPPSSGARTVRRVLFAAALVVNLVAMYAPSVPEQVQPPSGARLDLLGHAATFAALTLTGLLAGVRPPLLLGLVAANAVMSEVVQHLLLPRRSGDVTDMAADAVGIVLGWLAWRWWERVRARRRAPRAAAPSGPGSSARR